MDKRRGSKPQCKGNKPASELYAKPAAARQSVAAGGVIGSGTHSLRNQNKNATDSTDLQKFSIKYWGRQLDTMRTEMLYEELSGTVIGAAMEIHKLLGSGFLESVYERALALELTERRIPFERQVPITVMYKQAEVGEYRADFLVDGKIILEIRATTALIAEHYAQALHYLTATGLRLALLLNFGTRSLQFKRINC